MARKRLWMASYHVYGVSKRTGRKFTYRTRSDRHVEEMCKHYKEYYVIWESLCLCISLGQHKGVPREVIDAKIADIRQSWKV
jgi:hypothetical protein